MTIAQLKGELFQVSQIFFFFFDIDLQYYKCIYISLICLIIPGSMCNI